MSSIAPPVASPFGRAYALSLMGHSNRQIQKMGHWKGYIFKKYLQEELHAFSTGMSRNMKRLFKFVNIPGGIFDNITSTTIAADYTVKITAAG